LAYLGESDMNNASTQHQKDGSFLPAADRPSSTPHFMLRLTREQIEKLHLWGLLDSRRSGERAVGIDLDLAEAGIGAHLIVPVDAVPVLIERLFEAMALAVNTPPEGFWDGSQPPPDWGREPVGEQP
jgi:hypothetical protein